MNLRLSRVTLSAVLFALVTPALAGPRDDVLQAIGKCAAIGEDKARLACYDQVAPQVKSALATPPTEVATNKPPTKEQQESWFGFDLGGLFGSDHPAQTKPESFGEENTDKAKEEHDKVQDEGLVLNSISAGVTEVAFTPFGKFIVFLDNGQVWRQIEGDSDHARFKSKPTDNKVTISRGFLGSYSLTVNDSAKVYKVSRVK
jgi:hypothetical protein